MQFLFMALFAAGIVAADQLFKAWVLATIPLHGEVPVIDGLFHLTYAQNTGAAFSSLQGMRWLFVGIFLVLNAAPVGVFQISPALYPL